MLLLTGINTWAGDTAKIMPLDKVEPERVLMESAKQKPHVLFVNVGNALDEPIFREAVAAVPLAIPIRVAVANIKNFEGLNLFENKQTQPLFSEQTKLIVYVVNKAELLPFLSAPRSWAIVNVSGYNNNLPANDPERYRRRMRQLMLKGLGLASGLGGNTDTGRCVMASDSFSRELIDSTSLSFSPFAYVLIEETLLKIGTEEIFQSSKD